MVMNLWFNGTTQIQSTNTTTIHQLLHFMNHITDFLLCQIDVDIEPVLIYSCSNFAGR